MITKDETIIVRSVDSILAATLKAVQKPADSIDEISQLARMAFFHRAQVDLWDKLAPANKELTGVAVSSYGSLCRPEVLVFFSDGIKLRRISDHDIVCIYELEQLAIECIREHEAHKTE